MRHKFLILLLAFSLMLSIQPGMGGITLIKSFVEKNNVGNTHFGTGVSDAGDVNNDGYDDVIIGASAYYFHTGRAYVYFGGAVMDSIPDVIMTGEGFDSYFGGCTGGAGDVNNDGYDDVIVGSHIYSDTTGRAYIYYGGPTMDNVADVVMTGEKKGVFFGVSVDIAGDVNGDGYDDAIVGSHFYNDSTGRAYIFYGGASMDNIPDVVIDGEVAPSLFGFSVSNAGDVNNDGYDDVIIGAFWYNSKTGRAYVYYGGSTMDNVADVVMTGEATDNHFGWSVAGAGDVNSDGYDDVIVGAGGYSNSGRVYVYFGSTTMDNVADVIFNAEGIKNEFGHSVSGAGDVNSDGYDDVIVGAAGYNSYVGRAYVFYGGSPMDNVADVVMDGEGVGIENQFGWRLCKAGDVNSDGYDDVIVGSYKYKYGTGRAYIFYGGSTMNNIVDVILEGEGTDNYFGISVSGAGDVNSDGYDDIIIGAHYYDLHTGRAYLYYGSASMDSLVDLIMTGEGIYDHFGYSVSGAGDVNNDGYDDVIVGAYGYNDSTGRAYIYFGGSSMNNIADVTMNGENTKDYFGVSVSGAGDVNNDGYDDVIVGAPFYNDSTGRAYIFYGGSTMNNVADVTVDGEATHNHFGWSVSDAGDVNNDNYDDVIVGAYRYNSQTGRAYVYFGGSAMNNIADVTFTGEGTSNNFGWSVSGAGDVNNDGYSDVIVGAGGYNDIGRAYIYLGGSAMDIVADVTMDGEGLGNEFGSSVSDAGDVNNDGYGDVIVGADGYNSYTGRAYIYFGGATMDNIADFIADGEMTNTEFGWCVSGAGDIDNNGYDDVLAGAYPFPLNGKAYLYGEEMASAPEIDVQRPAGTSIADGGTDNLGNQNSGTVNLTYTIDNSAGTAQLEITDVTASNMTNCSSFNVVTSLPLNIAAGASEQLQVSFNVDDAGAFNFNMDIINNDADENPYDISVSGTGVEAEMDIQRPLGTSIADGGTDNVGSQTVGTVTLTYYADNSAGTAQLEVTAITASNLLNCSNLTVSTSLPLIVPPGATATFEISFDVDASGAFSLDLEIESNDDDSPYNIHITGDGAQPTYVELSSFSAEVGDSGILLRWTTEAEPDNAGFNIYRSQSESGDYVKVNENLIPSQGNATSGAEYSYLDKPDQAGNYNYKLQSVSVTGETDFHGPVSVILTGVDIRKYVLPTDFSISQNYPNPFNPETMIEYSLPEASQVTISIYDANGRLVRQLVSSQRTAGIHDVKWDGRDDKGQKVVSGVYFYHFKAASSDRIFSRTNKMILMK